MAGKIAFVLLALAFGRTLDAQQSKTIPIVLTQPWTQTGLTITQGQSVRITAEGTMDWCSCPTCCQGAKRKGTPTTATPDGASCSSKGFAFPDLPCWALVGRIGNGKPFNVGSSLTFTAETSGELFLGVNDSYYPDNAGDWKAAIIMGPTLSECSITSQTLAIVPGTSNLTRTRVGVGESVLLTANIPVTWTISSGAGSLSGETAATTARDFPGAIGFPNGFPSTKCAADSPLLSSTAQSCFIAPYSNSTTVVTAMGGGSMCSTTISTVQPTGLIYQRLEYPAGNPDYYFEHHALDYVIGMTGGVFLTPGDVSFVNIRIRELDNPKVLRFDPNYNLLFNVGGTNAWLVGCDKIQDNTYGANGGDPVNPKSFYWEFADNLTKAGGHATAFSLVQTAWTPGLRARLRGIEFTKGQIQALASDGSFVPLLRSASTLTLPAGTPDFRRWIVGNPVTCPGQVEAQPQIKLIH